MGVALCALIGCRHAASFALDCTSDEFLVGNVKYDDAQWQDVADLLRNMNAKKLDLAKSFLHWLTAQEL